MQTSCNCRADKLRMRREEFFMIERRIEIAIIIFLLIISAAISQPQCNSTDGIKHAQLGDRVAISCRCNNTENNLPQWKINGSQPLRYDELPSRLKVKDQDLVIKVEQSDNSTTYQCIFNVPDSPAGGEVKLIVNSTLDVKGSLVRRNYIDLKFKESYINITLKRYDISCVQSIVKRFTYSQIATDNLTHPDRSFNFTTKNYIIIPAQELQGFYFEVFAVNNFNEACTSERTEATFYYFDDSHIFNISYTVPKQDICFPVPEQSCAPIYIIWPQTMANTHSCICGPYEDSFYPFSTCMEDCDSSISAKIVNNEVCFTNLSLEMNNTSIFFECVQDLCPSDCYIHSILSSHEIIIDGPPSAPTVYSPANNYSFVCFDAYSSPRHPVQHYYVNVTDDKVQHLENEVYSRINDTITQCHNVSDLLEHNDTIKVFVSADNSIGTSNVTEYTLSKEDPSTIPTISLEEKIIVGSVVGGIVIIAAAVITCIMIGCCTYKKRRRRGIINFVNYPNQ